MSGAPAIARPGSVLAFADLAPVAFMHVDVELLGRGADPRPGFVPLMIGHPLDLIEAGDRTAYVARVFQGFLALLRKRELAGRDVVAVFLIQLAHEASFT